MITLAIANHKGGVGKTTTALALAVELAKNLRVLLIDFDPQATLTEVCGLYEYHKKCIADVLEPELDKKLSIADILLEFAPNIRLAPADLTLVNTTLDLTKQPNREFALKQALYFEKDNYDVCIIDCPPSLNLLTANALTAADGVLIPSRPQTADLQSLHFFLDSVDRIQKELNAKLSIFGIMVTFFDDRLNHHKAFAARIRELQMPLLPISIGRSIRVAEALAKGQSITKSDPSNPVTNDYRQLVLLVQKWLSTIVDQ